MDLKFSFRLKSSSEATKPSSIRLIIFHKCFGKEGRLVYGTGEKIAPIYFDPVAGRPVKDAVLLKGLSKEEVRTLKRIDSAINAIQVAADQVINHFQINHLLLNAADFKTELDNKLQKNQLVTETVTETVTPVDLNAYIKNYIAQLEKSERLTAGGKVFMHGSIKNYKTFKAQFDLYQQEKNVSLNFDDITMDFYFAFVRYLTIKDYSPNTIGKHIARLKKIMRSADEEGLHQTRDFMKSAFKVTQINTESIYLHQNELEALQNYDCSDNPEWDLHRDIFLIGCHLAQRVSDYNDIKPVNITKTSSGTRVIKIIQKKTGEQVMIPINTELEKLLKKYNYAPPAVAEGKLNESIKLIAKKVGLTELVEIEKIKGGKKLRETVPKYELIKTHTARRSGITNMYLADIQPIDIMKISGHKKESSFMKYIRLTKEETANKLSKHPYFK